MTDKRRMKETYGQRLNATAQWRDHLNWDKVSNHRQHDLTSFKDPGCWSGLGLNLRLRPLASQTGALKTELINGKWNSTSDVCFSCNLGLVTVACVASVSNRVVPSFPSPSPVIHFFLLLSQLSRRTSRGNACYAGYGDCFNRPFAGRSHVLGYNLADGSLDGKLSRRSFLSKSFECDRAIIQITEIKVECNPRGVLPSDRLMGMCRWMGSHFHGWIKIQVGRDFRNGKIFTSLSLTNVLIHFKMT